MLFKYEKFSLNRVKYTLLFIVFLILYSYFFQIDNILVYDPVISDLATNYHEFQSRSLIVFQVIRKFVIRYLIFITFTIYGYVINNFQVNFQFTVSQLVLYIHKVKKLQLLSRFNKSKYKDSL